MIDIGFLMYSTTMVAAPEKGFDVALVRLNAVLLYIVGNKCWLTWKP
jgi:hypothetical protein